MNIGFLSIIGGVYFEVRVVDFCCLRDLIIYCPFNRLLPFLGIPECLNQSFDPVVDYTDEELLFFL